MSDLNALYARASRMHQSLCPRQVLGVRMGVLAGLELGTERLAAYRVMPDDGLLAVSPTGLTLDLTALVSEPGRRSTCDVCGEEINSGREVVLDGHILCRSCAGETYFVSPDMPHKTGHLMTAGPGRIPPAAVGRR
jgi:formylmethanofuran dehydrogenase subunit E